MIFGFTPFECICNLIFYSEFCVFLNSILTPRFGKCCTYISNLIVVVYLLLVSTVFARMSVLRILTLPVSLTVYNLIFYRDKRLRCVFAAWIVPVIIFLSEVIVVALVYNQEMLAAQLHTAPMKEQILCWGVEMVSAGLLYLVTSLVLNRVRNKLGVREMLMFTFFPMSQFLLLYGWMNATRFSTNEYHRLLVLVAMFLCLGTDVGLFAAILRVSRQKELEVENFQLAAQIEAQRTHYADLTVQYESIRRMRHDINKHINAVRSLLVAGRNEDAAAYMEEIDEAPYDMTLGICEHPVVDAFLHSAMGKAEKNGFSLDALVSVPAEVPIAASDLVCTYGNLLENAFEACRDVPGATVTLRTAVHSGYLAISTENPVGPETGRRTRIQGLERGIGFRVLKDLAKKYNGSFRYQTDGDVFRAEITYRLEV